MNAQHNPLRRYHTAAEFTRHTNEQEWDLIEKAQSGDVEARNEVITNNLRFVMQRAQRYIGRGVDLEDLVMEGNLGLFHAIKKFDVSRKLRFNTYAGWWVDLYISRAVMNQSRTVRLPVHRQKSKDYYSGYELIGGVVELDDEEVSIGSLLSVEDFGEDEILQEQTKQLLMDAIGELSPVHQNTLALRYGLHGSDPMTLDDVSKLTGFSRERVRQLCNKFAADFRAKFESLGLSAEVVL